MPLYALSGGGLCDANSDPVLVDRRGVVRYEENEQRLGVLRPPDPEQVQRWMAAILSASVAGEAPPLDLLLAPAPRASQARLRSSLPKQTQKEIAALRQAPVILNWDPRPAEAPLAYIRRGRRGIGDHAFTIFRTQRSTVFDQSHIFFDGVWGMAVSEILTDSAIHWYRRLPARPQASSSPAPTPLALTGTPEVKELAQSQTQIGETSAESSGVDMRRLLRLRKWLRQRGVPLTVNDLLLLYRFFHAVDYQPSPAVQRSVDAFREQAHTPEARTALEDIEAYLAHSRETNPALLIPMNASNVSPQERVFPTTFRNPLTEIYPTFTTTREIYQACRIDGKQGATQGQDAWDDFDQARRELLAYLKAFGEVLNALKAVTRRGESFNTATIRLLGHLPTSMQYLLDQVPQRIGVLNEVIKGNEVFSNVGRVASGSSLTRFISAKDDGEAKKLVWGFLTDDEGRMHVSLRDFRPFVPVLLSLGKDDLAERLTQDYVEGYVRGLNQFVVDLSNIVAWKGDRE
jgi:hypothetical protein